MRAHRRTILLCGLLLFSLNVSTAVGARGRPPAATEPDRETAAAAAAVAVRRQHTTLAGQILPLLRRFVITGEKGRAILKALSDAVSLGEFFLIGAVGWAWVPLNRAIFDFAQHFKDESRPEPAGEDLHEGGGKEGKSQSAELTHQEMEFESSTYWYQSARHISQAARIGAFIYAVDCLAVVLNTIGFRYKQQAGFSKKAANISFSVWVALRLGEFKKYFLQKAFRKDKNELGKVRVFDGVLNVVLATVTFSHILDMFDIDFGLALTSLLSLGGVGTLVLSLASKDLATELVSGLAVSASDRFLSGDEIILGDGTAGFITTMGLLHTDLRGYDEVITRIPNSQLASQRTKNLSRAAPRSQVKQTLRFSYSDIAKMPALLDAIKGEIRASCPELITDGSRPFRAHWRNFNDDHLEVVVDAHFNIKPTGDIYWDNRQKVLEAIARAAEKLGVDFILPSQICKTA